MSSNILLTGATGFVGLHLLQTLAKRGLHVTVVGRGTRKAEVEAGGLAQRFVATPDLFSEDRQWWQRACQGVDTVVHAAWYAEPGAYLVSDRNFDCLAGTLEMARGAALAGVRRFVGVGTCFEYEMRDTPLAIDTPLRPATPFAAAKAAAYLVLSQWLPRHSVSFAWCRLFYLYGPGEESRRLVPYLRSHLSAGQPVDLNSGTQVRDYLDVRVAAERIVDIASGSQHGPVNVCSGVGQSVREFAERIADEYGRRDLLRFGARRDNEIDPPYVVGVNGSR